MDSVNVVGVQFRRAGKIYHFTPGDYDVRIGDPVVVETDRGPSLAEVAVLKLLARSELGDQELKPIIRKASAKDLEIPSKQSPEFVENFSREALKRHELNLRILKAEVQLGGNKIIVYFSAPGRIDFRELVKDLATGLFARVELKQVGARDEAKLVGGIGICGREFCCSSFLREFVPVSIKMAKNQNLALNPTKVSGGCGRLLCCLTYENDTYTEMRRIMPGKGAKVRVIEDGVLATVIKSDLINQRVMVISDDEAGNIQTLPIAQLEILDKGPRPQSDQGARGDRSGRGDRGERGSRGDTSRGGRPAQAKGMPVSDTANESDDEQHVDEDLSEAEIWSEDIHLEDFGFEGQEKEKEKENEKARARPPQAPTAVPSATRPGTATPDGQPQGGEGRGRRRGRRGRGGGSGGGSGGGTPPSS